MVSSLTYQLVTARRPTHFVWRPRPINSKGGDRPGREPSTMLLLPCIQFSYMIHAMPCWAAELFVRHLRAKAFGSPSPESLGACHVPSVKGQALCYERHGCCWNFITPSSLFLVFHMGSKYSEKNRGTSVC